MRKVGMERSHMLNSTVCVGSCLGRARGVERSFLNPFAATRTQKAICVFTRPSSLSHKTFVLMLRAHTEHKENATAGSEDAHKPGGYGQRVSLLVEDAREVEASGSEGEAPLVSVLSEEAEHGVVMHTGPKRIAFDYGFQTKFLRKGPTVPSNMFKLALENFGREWTALRRSYLFPKLERVEVNKPEGTVLQVASVFLGRGLVLFLRVFDKLLQLYDGLPELNPEEIDMEGEKKELQKALNKLTLSNDAVWERERKRPPVEAPWWILGPYYVLCLMLDLIFKDRPVQRFWFLETVARMPYFSYISMLHLYETLGWWRTGAEVRKVHFAEEWNEMHHLKIMESLGGDLQWGDRFFAQHAAFFYYWILNFMFMVSPKVAYNFSELIEMHAVDTYSQFVDENEVLLKQLPPPVAAVEYYESEDLYMYDEFQTSRIPETRRPKVDNLFDVFTAIAGDEYEHVQTMAACQQLDNLVVSPHSRSQRV